MNKTTILIVEDETLVAENLSGKLANLGYEVAGVAAGAEEAIGLAGRLRPKLVLMDIWLKGPMDGIDAAEVIRQQHDIPVIYLTAHSDPATLARAKVSGPFGYILKPFEQRELATQIELALYKHQADGELRHQREWLRVTLASIGDAVIATDAAGRITFVNPVAEALTGCKAEEALGQPLQSVFHAINEQTGQPLEDPVVRVLREGRAVALANHAALITKDGRTVLIEDSAAPILDAARTVIGVVLVFHDVTEKRRAQESLRESEERLRLLVEGVKDYAIFMLDVEGRVVTWNTGAQRLKGYAADEVLGEHFARFYLPDDIEAGKPQRELTVAKEQGSFADEGWRVRKDGSRFWAAVTITALRDEAGRLRGFAKVVRDMSERRAMEEKLESLAQFPEENPNPVLRLAADGQVLYANAAAQALLRDPGSEAQSPARILEEAARNAFATAAVAEIEVRYADGRFFSFICTPLPNKQYVNLYGRDITERKRAEQELVEGRQRLAGIVGSAMDAIISVDAAQRIVLFNAAAEKMFRCPAAEAIGQPLNRFIPERFRGAHAGHIEAFGEAGTTSRAMGRLSSLTALRTNGEEFPMEASISQVEVRGQKLFTVILRDITERKRADLERETAIEFLRLVNAGTTTRQLVEASVRFFHEQSGCEAVGIRLRDGDDYPYYEAHGFPEEFVILENSLCGRTESGEIQRDSAGNPIMECMCGNVISGRFDPSKPFFTPTGSFWTNSTTELLANTTEADRQTPTRNRCNGEGYESVALIALRYGEQRLGLLQLNDRRKGMFTPEIIAFWERLTGYLGVALANRRAEESLAESEAKFRQLANSIPQLAWIARPDGGIFWYNQRWYEYTGTTPEQMEGWGWQSVHDPQELPKVLERWKASIATGQPFDMEFPLRRADGQFRWFLTRVMPLRDPQGQVALWFGTNTDITAQREVTEQLQRAKEAADAANEAKSQFLMNMSHELRTPMNSIMGMTELVLAERDLSPMARDCLQTAKDSADGLLELINEILDFSRIEAGKLRLDSRPFVLREVLDKTLKPLAIRASQKKLELTCDVEANVPNSVVGDPLTMRQVLTNLVGNAIKFTQKGDVVVRAKLVEKSDHDVFLEFAVSDTGIGIAPEDQERIIAPFAQVDASLSRQYGGTGLGLTISNRLITLSGGKMWLESNVGSGSIFHFTVRLGLQPGANDGFETTKVARARFHNVPVLVVDDNAASRHSLERMLAQWAMKAETADYASAALIKLHEATAAGEPFRVVLVNAVMSGTDGFTLASWINNNRDLAGPVILMISAVDRQEMVARCEQVKAIYVEKPVAQADLLDALTKALGGEATVRLKPIEPEVGEISTVTTKPLHVLVAEDNPPNQKFIVFALQSRGHHVKAASNGQEALDLLHQHDFDAVLMDLQMPVIDGLEATASIRKLSEPNKAKVPIIALTAHAMQGDEERCLAAGMDAYISKPVNVPDLFAVLERSAGSSGSLPSGPGAEEPWQSSGSPAIEEQTDVVFDFDTAMKRCMGKRHVFLEFVKGFFTQVDDLLRRMYDALASGDTKELTFAAHRLGGTLRYFGTPRTFEAPQRVERIAMSGNLTGAAEAIGEVEQQAIKLKEALAAYVQ